MKAATAVCCTHLLSALPAGRKQKHFDLVVEPDSLVRCRQAFELLLHCLLQTDVAALAWWLPYHWALEGRLTALPAESAPAAWDLRSIAVLLPFGS